MHRRAIAIFSWVFLSVGMRSATACPYCKTETGRQVQAAIFNDQFWSNATLVLLPLLVLLGIVALIHFDVSRLWPTNDKTSSPILAAPGETDRWQRDRQMARRLTDE